MVNYNYFFELSEATRYFRLPFSGKGVYCQTLENEPYLREIPIEVRWEISLSPKGSESGLSQDRELSSPLFILKAKWKTNTKMKKDFSRETILVEISEERLAFQEDLLDYQSSTNKISIQALTEQTAYLFWEEISPTTGKKSILYNGKLSQKENFWNSWNRLFSQT